MAENEEGFGPEDILSTSSNFSSGVGPIKSPVFARADIQFNGPNQEISKPSTSFFDKIKSSASIFNPLDPIKEVFGSIKKQADKAKTTNKLMQQEIDREEKKGNFTQDKLFSIQDKYSAEGFIDSTKQYIGNVASGLLFDKNEAHKKIDKLTTKEIDDAYAEKGFKRNDFTNALFDTFSIGKKQARMSINGAISAEDEYARELNDKAGLTYDEIEAYEEIENAIKQPEIQNIINVIDGNYASVEGYQGLVSTVGVQEAGRVIRETYKQGINDIQGLLDVHNKTKDKINGLQKSFQVKLPGIGSGFMNDSSKTQVTGFELFNKLQSLRSLNNDIIQKSTGLTREEFQEAEGDNSTNRTQFSFKDTASEGIKKTEEYKNEMAAYSHLSPNDRTVKSSEIQERIKNNFSLESMIKNSDQEMGDQIRKVRSKYNIAQSELGAFTDKVVSTVERNKANGMYKNILDHEARDQVARELISNFTEQERLQYAQSLQDIELTNSFSGMYKGTSQVKEGLANLDASKLASGLLSTGGGLFGGAFEMGGEMGEDIYYGLKFWGEKNEDFVGDMLNYAGGVRNVNAGIATTLKDLALYGKDDIFTVGLSLLNPNKASRVEKGLTLIGKVNKIDTFIDTINSGYKSGDKMKNVITKIKTNQKLLDEEIKLISNNKALKNSYDERIGITSSKAFANEKKIVESVDTKGYDMPIVERMRLLNETSPIFNKATRTAGFVTDSTVTGFKADAGIEQAMGTIVTDEIVGENFMFNLLGDAILGAPLMALGRKYARHGMEVNDVAKLFDSNKDLREGILEIRRAAMKINGGQLVSNSDALTMLRSSTRALSAYSAKNGRLETKEEILDFTKDALRLSEDNKFNYAYNVTDTGKIISFNDNLSRLASQETRLTELTNAYNRAATGKNPNAKLKKVYADKIEDELKLMETLIIDPKEMKNQLKGFIQNNAGYLQSNLKISNPVIKAEVQKGIRSQIESVRKNLAKNVDATPQNTKKLSTDEALNHIKDAINEYDEALKGGRLMEVYDPYTQKSFKINPKMVKVQAKALALEKNISEDAAMLEIMSKGGITMNIDMVYIDAEDATGAMKRYYGFSHEGLETVLQRDNIVYNSLDIKNVENLQTINRFTQNNKRSKEVNKAYAGTIQISEQVEKGYAVSFTKGIFGKDNIEKHFNNYVDEAHELSFKKVVGDLNVDLEKIAKGFKVDTNKFALNLERNIYKIFQSSVHMNSYNIKDDLIKNASFNTLSDREKVNMVEIINNKIVETETKYYQDILRKELGTSIISQSTIDLGNKTVSYNSILDKAQKSDSILSFVTGGLYVTKESKLNDELSYWNNIIYLLPGKKLRGKKDYMKNMKKVESNIMESRIKGSKMKGAKVLQPVRDYTYQVVGNLLRLKGEKGDMLNLGDLHDIISKDEFFDSDSYITKFFDVSNNKGKEEFDKIKSIVSYLDNKILTTGDPQTNEMIVKNFITNYSLNKEQIDIFMKDFGDTDDQMVILSRIFVSDTSRIGLVNIKTDEALIDGPTKKMAEIFKKDWELLQADFNARKAKRQEDIDSVREKLQMVWASDNRDAGKEFTQLSSQLEKMLDNESRQKLISYETYVEQNVGLAMYQDIYDQVATEIIDHVDKFHDNFIKGRKELISYTIKKADPDKLNQKQRDDLFKIIDSYSSEDLDIVKVKKYLTDKFDNVNKAVNDEKMNADKLSELLGTNTSKLDKDIAVTKLIEDNTEKIEGLTILLEKMEGIQLASKPKKPVAGDIITSNEPQKVILDISESDYKNLLKEIKDTRKTLTDINDEVTRLAEKINTKEFKKAAEDFEKFSKNLGDKKLQSQVFNDIYNSINDSQNSFGDLSDFKILTSEPNTIRFSVGSGSELVEVIHNIENLSNEQIAILTDVLNNISKHRAGIVKSNLLVTDIKGAQDAVFSEAEISDIIYRDMTDSLFLGYNQKESHDTIMSNIKAMYKDDIDNIPEGEDLLPSLYSKTGSEFNKFIDRLYFQGPTKGKTIEQTMEEINKDFSDFVEKAFNKMSYSYRTEEGVVKTISSSEVITHINMQQLRDRFTNLRYQDNSTDGVVQMGIELSDEGYPVYKSGIKKFIQLPTVYKRLKESASEGSDIGYNIRYLDGFSEKSLKALIKTQSPFKFAKGEELDQMDLMGIINKTYFKDEYANGKKIIKGEALADKYRSLLGLKEGEILGLGFGDKDGFSFIYKNNDIILPKDMNIREKQSITELLYFYDVSINAGFIKTDVTTAKKALASFITKFNKSKDQSFESFKEEIFTHEYKKAKLVDMIAGAKKYKEDATQLTSSTNKELTQGERMFKTSSDNIRKRLASSASVKNLFYGYKGDKATLDVAAKKFSFVNDSNRSDLEELLKKYISDGNHKTFIINVVKDDELKALLKNINLDDENNFPEAIEIFREYAETKQINTELTFNSYIGDVLTPSTQEEIVTRIKAIYLGDGEDGTGYMTKDIGDQNKKINGGNSKTMKTHIQGVSDVGQTNLGKGLLNADTIKFGDTELTNTLVMGDGMHKISGGATMFGPTGIYLEMGEPGNIRKYEIIGVDDNIDFSFYKEATSTRATSKEDVSINNMVNSFDKEFGKKLQNLQQEKVEAILLQFERDFLKDDSISSSFGDINILMEKLLVQHSDLKYSDQYMNQKFNKLFTDIQSVVDEVRTNGYGFKALRADPTIHPDTIKLNSNNPLAKTLLKDFGVDIDGKLNPQYVLTTRYPISDKHVSGIYKVTIDDTIDEKSIVVHPENAFYKLRADFDGDTITTYSIKDEYASIASRGAYTVARNKKSTDIIQGTSSTFLDINIDDFVKHLDTTYEQTAQGKRLNTFIMAPEVKSIDTNNYRGFISNLMSAQKAKNGISIGASTVRTADIVQHGVDRLIEAGPKGANEVFNSMSHHLQKVIMNGYLNKKILNVEIYESKINNPKKFVSKISSQLFPIPEGETSITRIYKYLESPEALDEYNSFVDMYKSQGGETFRNALDNDSLQKRYIKFIEENLIDNFTPNPGYKSMDMNSSILSGYSLNTEDLKKLSYINQDQDFALITAEILNDFLDFGKSGKDSIDIDFDRKMIKSMYKITNEQDYQRLKESLSQLGMFNNPKWGEKVKITDYNLIADLNDTVSGNSLDIWNDTLPKLRRFVELKKASNELPFIMKNFLQRNYTAYADKQAVMKQFIPLDVFNRRTLDPATKYDNINEYLFSNTEDGLSSIIYFTRRQKRNLLSTLNPLLTDDLRKELAAVENSIKNGQNLKESVNAFFKAIETIKASGDKKDIINTVLLARVLDTKFQKVLKENNVNNLTIHNTMDEALITDYFNATINSRKLTYSKAMPALESETQELYLNEIKLMRDNLNKDIQYNEQGILDIKESTISMIKDTEKSYKAERIKLQGARKDLDDRLAQLNEMNKTKKSYSVKKEKYDSDLVEYNKQVSKLSDDEINTVSAIKAYEEEVVKYQLLLNNQKQVRAEVGQAFGISISKKTNEELSVELNKKIASLSPEEVKQADDIKVDLESSQQNISDQDDRYIIMKNGVATDYSRVSQYTSSKVKPDNPELLEHSADIGTQTQKLIQNIFNDNTITKSEYGVLENYTQGFEEFVTTIRNLKDEMIKSGETFYPNTLKISDDSLTLAGEVNIMTKTKDGKYKLYDIRTARDSSRYQATLDNLDVSKGNQLNMYAYMLEKNYKIDGNPIEIDSVNVMLFKAKYDYQRPIARGTETDISNQIYSIKLDQTKELTRRHDIKDINANLISNKIRDEDTVITPFQTTFEELQMMNKKLSATGVKKIKDAEESVGDLYDILDSILLSAPVKIDEDIAGIKMKNILSVDDKQEKLFDLEQIDQRLTSIKEEISNVDTLKSTTQTIKEIVSEKLLPMQKLGADEIVAGLKLEQAPPLKLEDLYTGWNAEMSAEMSRDMKGALDSFQKDWNFQFIDELQKKDPELLDRVNVISYHLGAEFDKLNNETVEWNNILGSIKASINGKKVSDVKTLTEKEVKEFDAIHSKLLSRVKSSFSLGKKNDIYSIGRVIKEAINGSLIADGGQIALDKNMLNDNFKSSILRQNTELLSYDSLIASDPELVVMIVKNFPDMRREDFTKGHLNYIYMMSNKELQYNVNKYIEGTVTYAIEKLNTLDAVAGVDLDLLAKYSKTRPYNERLKTLGPDTHSSLLIDDVMEAKKGDNNLAIISMGLSDKSAFMKRFIENGYSQKNANIMYNKMYKRERTDGQWFFDMMNLINYEMKYGKGNILHGAGTIAGIIQMPGQMTEILTRKASFGGISDRQISQMRSNYGFLNSEDTNVFASGIGLQNQDNMFSNLGVDAVSNMAYKLNEHIGKGTRSILDYATNPLGKHDAAFDNIRRDASIKQAMYEEGYKTYEDFVLSVSKFGNGELRRFETKARMIYNELGGGVSSKDSLYKINKAFNLSGYAEIDGRSEFVSFALRAWESIGGYLVHWMANKSMRQLEIATNLTRAVTYKQDWKAAKELSRLALGRARNVAYIALMGLKYDKYQEIDTSRKDGSYKLVSALANDVVAITALTQFAVNAHERAKLMDAGLSEEAIVMLQATTGRFTGSLNGVPNFTNSLYSKLKVVNWNKMTDAEKTTFIMNAVIDSVRDNGGNFNRYSGVNASEYGDMNAGFSFSTITGQGVGGLEGELEQLGWDAYGASTDAALIREGGFGGYLRFGAKALFGDKWFKSKLGVNSTEINRQAQATRIFMNSSKALIEIDKAFHDPDSNLEGIFNTITGERYTKPGDMVNVIRNGENIQVHKNQLIMLDEIRGYYQANGGLAIWNLNEQGDKKGTHKQEEQIRRELMAKEFGDLGEQFIQFTNEGGTLKYSKWVENRLAGFLLEGDGDVVIDRHVIATPEVTDYILEAAFKAKKTAYLESTFGKRYFDKGKGYDDIRDFDEKAIYLETLNEFKGLISMDRGLKRVVDNAALYMDDELQQSVYNSTGYYLPLSWKDEGEKVSTKWEASGLLPKDLNKYKQSDSDKKEGQKIMQRLQGFMKEDDLAEKLISEGETGRVSNSFKVLANTSRDVGVITRTMEKARDMLGDNEFKDLSLMFIDNMNAGLAKNSKGSKLMNMFEKSGAMKEYVNYMYTLTDAARDYDPQEKEGLRAGFNGFSRKKWKQQDYNGDYGKFQPGQGGGGMGQANGPLRQFVNNNKEMLYDNPNKKIQQYLSEVPFRPTYGAKKIMDYIAPRVNEVRLSQSRDIIKETGGPLFVRDNITYQKIKKVKKIRVSRSKIKSRIKYSRKTMNLLRGLPYGADDF